MTSQSGNPIFYWASSTHNNVGCGNVGTQFFEVLYSKILIYTWIGFTAWLKNQFIKVNFIKLHYYDVANATTMVQFNVTDSQIDFQSYREIGYIVTYCP